MVASSEKLPLFTALNRREHGQMAVVTSLCIISSFSIVVRSPSACSSTIPSSIIPVRREQNLINHVKNVPTTKITLKN